MNVEPRPGSRRWEKLGPLEEEFKARGGLSSHSPAAPCCRQSGCPLGQSPSTPHLISSLSHTKLDASWSLLFALSFPLSAPSWQATWAPRVELGVNSWVPTESSFSPEGTGVTSVAVSRRWWEAKASKSSGIGRGVASMPHITGDGGAQGPVSSPLWLKWTTFKKLQFVFPHFLRTLSKKCVWPYCLE